MIAVLKKEIGKAGSREERVNRLRELLQILLLNVLHDNGAFGNLVFTGGTALRILFDLRRFSEDLDFSLVHPAGYALSRLTRSLKERVVQYGLPVEVRARAGVVDRLDVKFPTVLRELALSVLYDEKLFIRMEIDTNPPAGGRTEVSLVNRLFLFQIAHFDLPSLFATKIPECFFRRYTKGRDFYDLLWYLTRKLEPDYTLLNNAVRQIRGAGAAPITRANLDTFLMEQLENVDFRAVRRDVERFLEDKKEAVFLTRENFLALAKKLRFP